MTTGFGYLIRFAQDWRAEREKRADRQRGIAGNAQRELDSAYAAAREWAIQRERPDDKTDLDAWAEAGRRYRIAYNELGRLAANLNDPDIAPMVVKFDAIFTEYVEIGRPHSGIELALRTIGRDPADVASATRVRLGACALGTA